MGAFMQDTQEKYFTAENIKTHISISVDANYWFNKEGRIYQDLSDLYNLLFPMELGEGGATEPVRREWLKKASIGRAQELWRAIKENPQSPSGPLTLAAISKAILVGANLNNSSDRCAFFILMQHNEDCRAIYLWAMQDKAVRKNEGASVRDLRNSLSAIVPSDDEARRLVRLWHGELSNPYYSLNTKIREATQTKNSTFFRELFELAPNLTESYSNDRGSPFFIGQLALNNPGVMEPVCLGSERPLGFLSQALNEAELLRILVFDIVWHNVSVADKRVTGTLNMKRVYHEPLLDSSAFIAQIEQPAPNIDGEKCNFLELRIRRDHASQENRQRGEYVLTLMPSEVQVVPGDADVLAMFTEMANLVRNGLTYFIRYRREKILALIEKVANLDFLQENKDSCSHYQELRYRLYHPVTIRAMEAFWHENIDAFIRAAGKNDQYLAHLLRHLTNPASLLIKILRQNKLWFVQRVGKLLPVIANIPGSRAQKDFNILLNEVVSAEGVESVVTVSELFRTRVAQCIASYAQHFSDAGEELFIILDNPSTRRLAKLSDQQVKQCLSIERLGKLERSHSRLEMIIAQDDRLFGKVEEPRALLQEANNLHDSDAEASEELKKYRSQHPTIWARFRIRAITASGNLNDYVQASKTNRGVRSVYSISAREAYIIASNDFFWGKIEAEKSSLKHTIFTIRMEWELHRDRPFDRFLVERLYSQLSSVNGPVVLSDAEKKEILPLIADIGRGEELFGLYSRGDDAVPSNPCRAKAFLAEINTTEKAGLAWDFVQKIDPANIDAEAIFSLMTRDEKLSAEQEQSGKTCFNLAVSLLEKKPVLFHQIILLHTKTEGRLPHGAMERLSTVVKNWLSDEEVVTPEVLQELMRAGLLKDQFSSDISLLNRLISVEVQPCLLKNIRELFFPSEESSSENGCIAKQKSLNGARSDNGYLRDKLQADNLLRLRDVFPPIFNKLMRDSIYLRDKLCAAINKMKDQEIRDISFTGFGYLFKEEPQFFYELLLRLPADKLDPPEALIAIGSDDIFMLNRRRENDGHHPLFTHMIKADLFQPENVELIMRCVNSKNRYLSRLMKEVLIQCIDLWEPKRAGDLLQCYLTHPQAGEEFSRAILVDGVDLRLSVKRLLLESNFVSAYLDKNKGSEKFSEKASKLWSALLCAEPFKQFLDSFQFNCVNANQVANERKLSRLHDEYKVTVMVPAKDSSVSLLAESFSNLFSLSGSDVSIYSESKNGNGPDIFGK